jgi:adenosylcobinamide-phosphate synthase
MIAAAFAVDVIVGDPRRLPHPVRAIGVGTSFCERLAFRTARGDARAETFAGGALTAAIVAASASYAALTIECARRCGAGAGAIVETVLAASTLAAHDLLKEAGGVLDALDERDLPRARERLARIVGRDTGALDEPEIARAVIETLAESACDGIVAPLCALAAGGVPLAFAFKAASTLDSMIGHIEPPYTHLGRVAANLDDAACLVPARLTALAICLLAPLAGGSIATARNTLAADGRRHRSPNAGRPEAAMAGALGVRLGGANLYDGVLRRSDFLGAQFRRPSRADARRACGLILWVASFTALAIAVVSAVCDED